MIGVIANPSEHAVVHEFFELFKTPWEFYRTNRSYEVLLCAGDASYNEKDAKLVLKYGSQRLESDAQDGIQISSQQDGARHIFHQGMQIPIYGGSLTFRGKAGGALTGEEPGDSVVYSHYTDGILRVRIGYDLFHEIRTLLTKGQPAVNAGIAALELHIALLRGLIVDNGLPLVEIPPVPRGYQFIACLTHDVDHPSIRLHKFDHTMFGFLNRAILGSVVELLRGRKHLGDLLANWAAALKLLFVYLGFANDFWCTFDRYVALEGGLPSTFFVIPCKDNPGRTRQGSAPNHRASQYGASDIADSIRKLIAAGCEIGLHGIDAWLESSSARDEFKQIRQVTGARELGVRMHWLYYDERSPETLEGAGASYDSTIGYNETIGYRAGTTQAYRPLDATQLLELPLHIMDTALFYPAYLHLSPAEALQRVNGVIDNAVKLGGSVTVNWHDRSIAPERLWGDTYINIVDELKSKGAWFATASQGVSWFRKRRSATFQNVSWDSGACKATIGVNFANDLPDLQLRVYNGQISYQTMSIRVPVSKGAIEPGPGHSVDPCIVQLCQ